MKIQWLGHSAFRLIESTGTTIITDPYKPSVVGYGMAYVNADAVTSSHAHSDHNFFEGVKGAPPVIDTPGVFEVKGVHIHGIPTHHDDDEGKKRGENIIYKFGLDGVSVCHLGDIGVECTPELIEQLIPVNILLIPVGGTYTIDAEQAKQYVDKLMPDVVIPMHFKIKHSELDISKVDSFTRLFDSENVDAADETTIEFDRYDFDDEQTKIIVPKRFKG